MTSEAAKNVFRNKLDAVEPLPDWLQLVRSQIESLKFGTVQVTVHDSKVVQIEKVEKTRLN
jgi:hypothetical protein